MKFTSYDEAGRETVSQIGPVFFVAIIILTCIGIHTVMSWLEALVRH